MTVATVKAVATRFLISNTPEVLALKGAWGVGKTYLWNQLIQQCNIDIKLANYCYVSLFGISSIKELRTAIFVKTKPVKRLGKESGSRIEDNKQALLSWGGLKSIVNGLSKLNHLPYIGNSVSITLETVASHFVSETIICLDDFERLNQQLITIDEILGIISELKEEKGCKVVLIFNEDKLDSRETYKRYREKVVDIELLVVGFP